MKFIIVIFFLLLISLSKNAYSQSVHSLGNKADSLFYAGKNQQALDIYNNVINEFQLNNVELSRTYDMRARCKRNLKQYKEAIDDDTYAYQLNPKNNNCLWNRAIIYSHNGDYRLAINDYTNVIMLLKDEKKNLVSLYSSRGYAEVRLNEYDKAIHDCDTAISFGLNSGFPYSVRARAQTNNGNFKLGIEDYLKEMPYYKNDNKRLAEIFVDCAYNSYLLSENEQVINYCTKAIELDSNSYSAFFDLGKLYLKKLKKDGKAVEKFKKVIELDTSKNSAEYAFSLFYLGNSDQAYKKMNKKLLEITTHSELIENYYNMACLLSLMNKIDDSNLYLKKAIQEGYSKEMALHDDDLDNIRNTKDFKKKTSEN